MEADLCRKQNELELPLNFLNFRNFVYLLCSFRYHIYIYIPISVSDISVSGKERKRGVRCRKSNFKGSLGIHFEVGSLPCMFLGSTYYVIAWLMIKSSTRRQKVVNF